MRDLEPRKQVSIMETFGRFTAKQIDTLTDAVMAGEAGATEYYGKPEYAARYIVGGIPSSPAIDPRKGREHVREIIEATAVIGGSDAESLGVWACGDVYFADAGDSFYRLDSALYAARERHQFAIWDRAAGSEIIVEEAR